ncbi:hypothetical protein ACSQ67_008570 [Phaseolus vulgaris]
MLRVALAVIASHSLHSHPVPSTVCCPSRHRIQCPLWKTSPFLNSTVRVRKQNVKSAGAPHSLCRWIPFVTVNPRRHPAPPTNSHLHFATLIAPPPQTSCHRATNSTCRTGDVACCPNHRRCATNELSLHHEPAHPRRVSPTSSACRTRHVACCPSRVACCFSRCRDATKQLLPRHELPHESRVAPAMLRGALAAAMSHTLHRVSCPPPCVALVVIASSDRFGKLSLSSTPPCASKSKRKKRSCSSLIVLVDSVRHRKPTAATQHHRPTPIFTLLRSSRPHHKPVATAPPTNSPTSRAALVTSRVLLAAAARHERAVIRITN